MKKISFYRNVLSTIFLLSLLTSVTKAEKFTLQSGFTMGLEVGNIMHKGNLTTPDGIQTIKIKGSSPYLGGVAGYNHVLSDTYFMGLEVFGKHHKSLHSRSYTTNGCLIKEAFTMEHSYGSNIVLGIHNINKSFYVKIGGTQTKFRLKMDSSRHASLQESKKKKGLLLGVGGDYLLNKNWSIGIVYDHILHKDIKFNDKFKATYKPDVHAMSVKIKYNF